MKFEKLNNNRSNRYIIINERHVYVSFIIYNHINTMKALLPNNKIISSQMFYKIKLCLCL